MQFDSVGSEQDPSSGIKPFSQDDADVLGGVDAGSSPRATAREGLPARFRMRHASHYVDALLGDAPLRTVREIPVSEIEPPEDDQAGLEELERSIRQLGVIEPLLVSHRGRQGASYRVIAGMRRLRAAQRVGLDTVPCLVHDVDEDRLADLRGAAAYRVTTAASIPEPVDAALPAEEPAVSDEARIEYDVPALQFVSALLPAMNAAAGDRLRLGVLTDLAAVELAHAKTVTEAFEIINRPRPIDRTSVDYQTLVSDAVASVATEARLRNVRLDVSALGPDNGPDIFLDGALCRGALTGMFQCLLALSPRGGTGLHVNAQLTSIRPALIVEGVLGDSDPELGPEALSRFFDAGWREHPCGPNAGALLAAFAHVARVHGGRVDVKPAARGCRVTFVVPRMEG